MTIEAKLDRTNELLEKLLAKFDHIDATASAAKESTPPPAKSKPVASSPAGEQPAAGAGALTYEKDVQPRAAELLKKNRDALVALLRKFGVKKATELKPEQLAGFLADVEEALK